MAKAALNQMARTCAKEYTRHRIFINAVDPGWVSFQQPHPNVETMKHEGIKLRLDSADNAAKICAPICSRIAEQKYFSSKLLRNYHELLGENKTIAVLKN